MGLFVVSGTYQISLQSPHFRAAHVLILESNLYGIEGNVRGIHNAHYDIGIGAHLESYGYARLYAYHIAARFALLVQFGYL